MNKVNYKTLYLDFVSHTNQLPESIKQQLIELLKQENKEHISYKRLIEINGVIKENMYQSRYVEHKKYKQLKVYDEHYIKYLLKYQQRNNMTNTALSYKFKLSRNTVARWKGIF